MKLKHPLAINALVSFVTQQNAPLFPPSVRTGDALVTQKKT